ncbi:hypothetical protein PF005_g24836 [Phytophthora fragariae]|uniref:Uncharacterized protein n=1 Tax=Phytophthora fragariae TaxID=53985 RepID=A0A6A3XW33_9STRA|nr:hypothetical protein PF009_g19019 [Phytophthora fragariae]KAE8994310.1 hypothetical protein PF011_g16778 [Phytophthora fragariae]KAE9093881.1 hypothetical protein PF007_g17959 [Phytophthora fragariae]KAE9094577.1 hypothetical protein PF010_g17046 [Phytophthora fragariae]KAE9095044.1 hypothetical protein PF006_g24082 [Phytophthora fragariae]
MPSSSTMNRALDWLASYSTPPFLANVPPLWHGAALDDGMRPHWRRGRHPTTKTFSSFSTMAAPGWSPAAVRGHHRLPAGGGPPPRDALNNSGCRRCRWLSRNCVTGVGRDGHEVVPDARGQGLRDRHVSASVADAMFFTTPWTTSWSLRRQETASSAIKRSHAD